MEGHRGSGWPEWVADLHLHHLLQLLLLLLLLYDRQMEGGRQWWRQWGTGLSKWNESRGRSGSALVRIAAAKPTVRAGRCGGGDGDGQGRRERERRVRWCEERPPVCAVEAVGSSEAWPAAVDGAVAVRRQGGGAVDDERCSCSPPTVDSR